MEYRIIPIFIDFGSLRTKLDAKRQWFPKSYSVFGKFVGVCEGVKGGSITDWDNQAAAGEGRVFEAYLWVTMALKRSREPAVPSAAPQE